MSNTDFTTEKGKGEIMVKNRKREREENLFRKKRHPCYIVPPELWFTGHTTASGIGKRSRIVEKVVLVRTYCRHHNYQLKKGMKMPAPCRSCGVGVLCDYRLCLSCGGSALRKMLIRKQQNAKKQFDLVLQELMKTDLEI